jgi:hypothetical protein
VLGASTLTVLILVSAVFAPRHQDGHDSTHHDTYGSIVWADTTLAGGLITYRVGVYGLGGTHEISGRFHGTIRDVYFNADGLFVDPSPHRRTRTVVPCPAFRHQRQSARGIGVLVVTFPRSCVPLASQTRARLNLLAANPHDHPGVFILVDSIEVGPARTPRN